MKATEILEGGDPGADASVHQGGPACNAHNHVYIELAYIEDMTVLLVNETDGGADPNRIQAIAWSISQLAKTVETKLRALGQKEVRHG